MDKITSLIASRRFWVSLVGFVGVVLTGFGLELDEQQQTTLVSAAVLIASWVFSDGIRATEHKPKDGDGQGPPSPA